MFLVFCIAQAIPGTIITTQVPIGPSVDNNFITPPRIDDAAVHVMKMQQGYLQNMQHVYT